MDSKLSNEEKTLIIIQSLYFFGATLATVFLSIYLFKLGGFPSVTLFYLLNYLIMIGIYIMSGYLLRKIASKILIIIALVLFTFFWATLFFMKQNAITFIVHLGIWFGVGQGLFWSGLNLTQYIVSHESRRNRYFGWLVTWLNAVRGIAPVIGGLIIATSLNIKIDGYGIVFLIVCFINILNMIFALRLPTHLGVIFSLKHLFNSNQTSGWKMVLTQQFILGLWDVSLSNLFGVVLYLIFTSELAVGSANAILNIVAAAGAALAPMILHKKPQSPAIAGVISGIGLVLFALLQNTFGLIVLAVCTLFTFQIIIVRLSSAILTGIDRNPGTWQNKYHMLIERDTVLGIARSISFILLWIAFTNYPKESVAPLWLTIIAVFPPILGILVVREKLNFKK